MTRVLLKLLTEAGVVVLKPRLSKHGPVVSLTKPSRGVSREHQACLVESMPCQQSQVCTRASSSWP